MGERYGWGPSTVAQLHPSEMQLYLKGAELREEEKQRAADTGNAPSADQRRREQDALQQFA